MTLRPKGVRKEGFLVHDKMQRVLFEVCSKHTNIDKVDLMELLVTLFRGCPMNCLL